MQFQLIPSNSHRFALSLLHSFLGYFQDKIHKSARVVFINLSSSSILKARYILKHVGDPGLVLFSAWVNLNSHCWSTKLEVIWGCKKQEKKIIFLPILFQYVQITLTGAGITSVFSQVRTRRLESGSYFSISIYFHMEFNRAPAREARRALLCSLVDDTHPGYSNIDANH